jgi:hypothetical protein
MSVDVARLWAFLPVGYLVSVLIETPVLWFALSPRHSWQRRLFAGLWLTACSYPIVALVLPILFDGKPYGYYLALAESFAPMSECALFWVAFGDGRRWRDPSLARDLGAVVAANLCSFVVGLLILR